MAIAEAMDTVQPVMGLDWPRALALIRRTHAELPDELVANRCGLLRDADLALGRMKYLLGVYGA